MKKNWLALALALSLFVGQTAVDTSVALAKNKKEEAGYHTMGSGIEQMENDPSYRSLTDGMYESLTDGTDGSLIDGSGNEVNLTGESGTDGTDSDGNETDGSDGSLTDGTEGDGSLTDGSEGDGSGEDGSDGSESGESGSDETASNSDSNSDSGSSDSGSADSGSSDSGSSGSSDSGSNTSTKKKTTVKYNWNLKKRVKMVDLSYWDGNVNFKKLKKAGISYVMLRIGHGMEKDVKFTTFYKAAKKYGFKIGIYYYSTATTVTQAKKEANYTLALLKKYNIKPKNLTLPVCFDFEDPSALKTSRKNCTNMAVSYLNKIKKAGYEPMIYSSGNFFIYNLYYSKLKSYKIWVANWKVKGPIMPYAYDAWQYTATARVSGLSYQCDVSVLYPKYVAVTKLTAKTKTVAVAKGKKKRLSVTMSPSNCTNKRLIWKTGDKSIVKILDDQNGIIQGLKKGKTIVKAKTPNGKSYTFTVTVK